MKAIADTGFLVAFANRNDQFHDWAVGLASQVTEPLLCCEAVLAEAAFHLGSVSVVIGLIDDGLVRPSFELAAHLPQISDLAERYADQSPDLADLCVIRMSELYPEHAVLTVDRTDFTVYRRNKREAIPTVFPPETRG